MIANTKEKVTPQHFLKTKMMHSNIAIIHTNNVKVLKAQQSIRLFQLKMLFRVTGEINNLENALMKILMLSYVCGETSDTNG